jgi:hypothetical protein
MAWERRRRSQYSLLLEERLPGQRQPVKAASREAGARNAPALRGWRWSGLRSSKQRPSLRSQPQSSQPCERPVDSTAGHDGAGDVAADMLFERGAPGHEAESEAIVDHGEPATR